MSPGHCKTQVFWVVLFHLRIIWWALAAHAWLSVILCPLTGGFDQVRGEHWSQLPLPLAGVFCLCVRTLPEGHRVVPPQGEMIDEHWILTSTVPTKKHLPLWIMFTLICTEPCLMNTHLCTELPCFLCFLCRIVFIVNGYIMAHVWCELLKSPIVNVFSFDIQYGTYGTLLYIYIFSFSQTAEAHSAAWLAVVWLPLVVENNYYFDM